MTTIISITSEPTMVLEHMYDYSDGDRILKNIISNDYEIFYSGQNQGLIDHQLISSVEEQNEFRVYYRPHIKMPFTYLGSTTISSIIRERIIPRGQNSTPNERLQIRLVILRDNVIKQLVETQFEGSGKYKKAILQHSNFNINQNINIGFYKQ